MKKAALRNLGCKVNAYETQAMRELLERAGYEIVSFDEKADVYIVNTCTVTNMADRKSRQMLHRARRTNPDAIVVATGCYAQICEDEGKSADPAVDIAIGNGRKKDIVPILEEYERKGGGEKKELQKYFADALSSEYEPLFVCGAGEHTRAYIKVQDGCSMFCSYCIIPYVRGRERSRKKEEVAAEAKRLAKAGYKEIVLDGIHLSSYGADLPGKENLLTLIEAVQKTDGIQRIRLGSLEPRVITPEFVKAISSMPKLCPHFHLSLQSGCDATLKRMNRHYTSGAFYEKCQLLREYFDSPALTTDIIVGFPGESEEEFTLSRDFVEKVGFYRTHVFKYSRREGTKAAHMEGQVPEEVKDKRSVILLRLNEIQKARYERSFFGKEVEVLAEQPVAFLKRRIWTGYTREYIKVSLISDRNLKNQIVKVLIPQNSDFFIEI